MLNQFKQQEAEIEVCNGLSEVCKMLSKLKDNTPDQKKRLLGFAETFTKFANFHKVNNLKEVKMVETIKHPTQEEIEVKKVGEVIAKLVALEKEYSQSIIKRACYKYNLAVVEKNKAEKEIKVLEQKLAQAKNKLK